MNNKTKNNKIDNNKIKTKIKKNESIHTNHRARVKQKFLSSKDKSLFQNYEILEMILFSVYPRKDTKVIAKQIINHFGNLYNLVTASEPELKKCPQVSKAVIFQLKLNLEIHQRLLRNNIEKQHILSNWKELLEYAYSKFSHLQHEETSVLYLNSKLLLIKDEIMSAGTVDKVSLYPREVIKRIIEIGATKIILIHNHPSGDITPSKEDIEITTQLKNALSTIEVELVEHLIIGKKDYFSFKNNELI